MLLVKFPPPLPWSHSCISRPPWIPNYCSTSGPFSARDWKTEVSDQECPPLLASTPLLKCQSPKRWPSSHTRLVNLPMLQNPPSPNSSGILFHQRFHSIPFGLGPEDPVFGFLLTLHSLRTILSMSITSTLAYKLKPSRLQPYPEFSKPIYSIATRKLLGCHTNHIQNPFCLPFPPLTNNICTQPAGQARKSIKLLHFNFLVCKVQTSTYIVGLI